MSKLAQWQQLSYLDLAFEILSLFIDRTIMSDVELKNLRQTAYSLFEQRSIIPLHKLASRNDTYIMELFHGPTIFFKDIGLAFLVHLVNFFLQRRGEHQSLVVATTGDTGPATAYFAAEKPNIDAWLLYANMDFKHKLKLSCVNSINWGRAMMQTVHYFYGYLQVVDNIGEKINFSVSSGGFGSLCAGALAREMGLPVKTLSVANNINACLDRILALPVL